MTDLVSLKFQVNTEDLKKGQVGLDGIAASGKTASESVNQFNQQSKGATSTVGTFFNKIKPTGDQMGSLGRKAGQAGIQIQQFAGQVQMGTSVTTALSQQAADLGFVLGFPLLGAVTGLAAGLAGPLLMSLTDIGGAVDELEEELDDLVSKYNELSGAQKAYAELEIKGRIKETEAAMVDLGEEAKGLKSRLNLILTSDARNETEEELAKVNAQLELGKQKIKEYKDQLDGSSESTADLIKQLRIERDELGKTARQVAILKAEREGATTAQIKEINLLYDQIEAQQKIDDQNKKGERSRKKYISDLASQTKASERLIQQLKTKTETLGMTRAEQIRYNAAVAAAEAPTDELRDAILAEAEAYAVKVERMAEAESMQKELDEASKDAAAKAKKAEQEYSQTFNKLSNDITDAIMDFRSLGDVATAVAEQIKRAFVQNTIVNPLLGAFGMPTPAKPSSQPIPGQQPNILSSAGSIFDIFNGSGSAGFNAFATSSLGTALGLSTPALSGATLASTYGLTTGVAGSGSAAALTGAGSFLSTALPVVGLLAAFSGAFKKPSDKLQTSSIDIASGFTFAGGFEGEKFSQENRDFADALALQVSTLAGLFEDLTGKSVGGGIDLLIGNRDGLRLQYNGDLVLSTKDTADFISGTQDFVADLYGVQLDAYRNLTPNGEELANVINSASIASEVFSAELWELAEAYSQFSLRGETTIDFLGRVTNAAIADLQEFALAMQNTFAGIESLAGLSISIREQLLSDEQLYDRLREQADAIGESINTLSSPEAIQQAIVEYQSLSGRAFGLLSEEQQQLFGAEIADSIDSVVMTATERANALIDEQENNRSIEDFATSTQEMANTAANFGSFVEQFGDFVQQATQAAQGMLNASATLREAAQESTSQTNNVWTGRL